MMLINERLVLHNLKTTTAYLPGLFSRNLGGEAVERLEGHVTSGPTWRPAKTLH